MDGNLEDRCPRTEHHAVSQHSASSPPGLGLPAAAHPARRHGLVTGAGPVASAAFQVGNYGADDTASDAWQQVTGMGNCPRTRAGQESQSADCTQDLALKFLPGYT